MMVRSNQRGHSDNIYCHNLTAWRRDIGEYFGGLIQGNCAIFSFLSSGGLFIAYLCQDMPGGTFLLAWELAR